MYFSRDFFFSRTILNPQIAVLRFQYLYLKVQLIFSTLDYFRSIQLEQIIILNNYQSKKFNEIFSFKYLIQQINSD